MGEGEGRVWVREGCEVRVGVRVWVREGCEVRVQVRVREGCR